MSTLVQKQASKALTCNRPIFQVLLPALVGQAHPAMPLRKFISVAAEQMFEIAERQQIQESRQTRRFSILVLILKTVLCADKIIFTFRQRFARFHG